ncbi:hypothetical protein HYX70_01300 [Candidatus Saccharibacteria bacterium]|nr:hypothetical protein [Candidatus Saccharibacteria bacterium]
MPNDHIPEEVPNEADGGWIDQKYHYDRVTEFWQDDVFATVNNGGANPKISDHELLFHAYEFVGKSAEDREIQVELLAAIMPDPRSPNDMRFELVQSSELAVWDERLARLVLSQLSTRAKLQAGTERHQEETWNLLIKWFYDRYSLPICFVLMGRKADWTNQTANKRPNIRLFFPVKPHKIYATFALVQLQTALVA